MELNRGDVLVNRKSLKEYAVAGPRWDDDGVDVVGLRNGVSYGPIRTIKAESAIKNFGKTAKTAVFANPTGWTVERVSAWEAR